MTQKDLDSAIVEAAEFWYEAANAGLSCTEEFPRLKLLKEAVDLKRQAVRTSEEIAFDAVWGGCAGARDQCQRDSSAAVRALREAGRLKNEPNTHEYSGGCCCNECRAARKL